MPAQDEGHVEWLSRHRKKLPGREDAPLRETPFAAQAAGGVHLPVLLCGIRLHCGGSSWGRGLWMPYARQAANSSGAGGQGLKQRIVASAVTVALVWWKKYGRRNGHMMLKAGEGEFFAGGGSWIRQEDTLSAHLPDSGEGRERAAWKRLER